MRRITSRIAMILVSLCLSAAMAAGQTPAHTTERKVVEKAAPVYPELAKRMHITGMVKLEVVVRPNGTVKTTKTVGGNPVLIQSAMDAVRKWKFEAAPEETTGIVELTFDPQQAQ
jgi:TonB family protein